MNIGDKLWHPCGIDIIEHKITSIRQFDGFNHYVAKAVNNVGACGKIEVIVDEHNGKFRFVELIDEDGIEYSSGLGDFVEGNYYADKKEAELDFYSNQETLTWSNIEHKERLYLEAKKNHERVKLIVSKIKESLKKK